MKWLNILGLVTVITVNALANILPINGMSTGQVASMYPNLFTPASITFSIWTVIYLLLTGFCISPFISRDSKKAESISRLFLITCLLNSSWILTWHHLLIEWSLIIMILLLVILSMIYVKIHTKPPNSTREKWLVHKPFSIYLAWISVATIANTAALLSAYGFSSTSPENWVIAMIIATQLLVYLISKKYQDIAFALVMIWALIGIIIKRTDIEPVFQPIIIACILAIIFDAWVALHYRYKKTLT
ncbi:hypothetical protein JMN32_10885 [Fulvivirga sp. 29W222]|uniref:Tryptophan-rich sensory protein n=1 Tax=Fulvivirga marina TaxID=2494733 RepID=A0A937FVI6_9BACT|nr:tryptophan-rich sensory protein [Fulvivirga marina]MBL6446819.1 hypothetical protein [Fulvivirga marina]